VLTLAQFLGATARWALDREAELDGRQRRRIGERIFRRDVTVDGFETVPGEIAFTIQHCDLHFAPAPALCQPMDRFGYQRETRCKATSNMRELTITTLEAAERRRDAASFMKAPWVDRTERVAGLVGNSMRQGITAAIFRHFADPGDDAPLRDALLQLAPATIQCFAALDFWERMFADGAVQDTGGLPDSCWIWRRDGKMAHWRSDTEKRLRG
jgi:hypothetical protein